MSTINPNKTLRELIDEADGAIKVRYYSNGCAVFTKDERC